MENLIFKRRKKMCIRDSICYVKVDTKKVGAGKTCPDQSVDQDHFCCFRPFVDKKLFATLLDTVLSVRKKHRISMGLSRMPELCYTENTHSARTLFISSIQFAREKSISVRSPTVSSGYVNQVRKNSCALGSRYNIVWME